MEEDALTFKLCVHSIFMHFGSITLLSHGVWQTIFIYLLIILFIFLSSGHNSVNSRKFSLCTSHLSGNLQIKSIYLFIYKYYFHYENK